MVPKNVYFHSFQSSVFFCGGVGLPLTEVFSFGQTGLRLSYCLDPEWAHARITMPASPPLISLTLAAVLILLLELFKSCT